MRAFLTALLLVVLVAAVATVWVRYRRDLRAARSRTRAGSRMVDTAAGPIEYAITGAGSPVLVLHGAAGGWDQGLYSARDLVHRGFRVIAPSRFGYLRTPMPAGASPASEADALAALLDALGIERAAVVSYSAGATPAFQLALRHPDRVSRLVFFVPGGGGVLTERTRAPAAAGRVFLRDFPMWAAQHIAPRLMWRLVGVPASLVPSLAPRDRVALETMVELILPVGTRRRGLLYDAHNQSGAEPRYPIERIGAPTLLVTAADDLYRTAPVARRAARLIPGARLIEYERGGHLLLGCDGDLTPRVVEFLAEPLPAAIGAPAPPTPAAVGS